MSALLTVPELSSLEQARSLVSALLNRLQQAQWRVAQLEKQLYGSSSERKAQESTLSKEQRRGQEELALHRTPGGRLAQCGDLLHRGKLPAPWH